MLLFVCQTANADQDFQKWSEKDLLRTGRALSVGNNLTSNLQMIPQVLPPIKTIQNFGINSSKINQRILNNRVQSELSNSIIRQYRSYTTSVALGGKTAGLAGALGELYSFNRHMWNCWRVGTGRAEPDVLRSTVPHVVMAWDALKGPRNIQNQTFKTPINYSYNDWALKGQLRVNKITHQRFSTTAPGTIGHYGFDPYTDKIIRKTSMQSIKIENFDGRRFNRMYQNSTPRIEVPKFSAPSIPKFEQPKLYTSPIQTYQLPMSYTPPKIYTPPSSFKR